MSILDIIKEMQDIYEKLNIQDVYYDHKWGEHALKELTGNLSLLGCNLSELERRIGGSK